MRQNANWNWSGGINPTDDDPLDGIAVGGSSYPIPRTRPLKPVLVDFTDFNAGTTKARHAYDARMAELEPTDSHVLANRRYRARKAKL